MALCVSVDRGLPRVGSDRILYEASQKKENPQATGSRSTASGAVGSRLNLDTKFVFCTAQCLCERFRRQIIRIPNDSLDVQTPRKDPWMIDSESTSSNTVVPSLSHWN